MQSPEFSTGINWTSRPYSVPGVRALNRGLSDNAGFRLSFFVCAFALLCGAAAGTVSAGLVNDPVAAVGKLNLMLSSEDSGYFSCLLESAKYELAVFFLSFFVCGAPLIPIVCLLRGFFLGFSAAITAGVYGSFFLNAAAFGITCLLSVPCLLMLAPEAAECAAALFSAVCFGRRNGQTIYTPSYFRRCLACAAVLCAAAALDTYLIPALLTELLPA